MEVNITREYALVNKISQLQSQGKLLRKALWIASGLISTMPDRSDEHPVDVYSWLIHEALEDARGSD